MNLEAEAVLPAPKGASEMELRPGERLLRYLLSEFDRPEFKDGSRLPTNKELARRLDVSPGTVQSVLRQLALEGRIRARRGSGTFLIQATRKTSLTHRIGIGVPLARLQATDGWMSRIAGGVFQAAVAGNVAIEGISDQAFATEAMVEELEEKRSHLDALILFPYTLPRRKAFLIDDYEKAGKPVVHVYPPSLTATANFATPDFFGPCYQCGQIWKKTGRRRIVLLTNSPDRTDLHANVSNQLRYVGMANGLGHDQPGEEGAKIRVLESVGREVTIEAGYESIKRLLARSEEPPDAIFSSGDWLAVGAFHALIEAGFSVPDQVSIIGAAGIDLSGTDCPNLTRVSNDLAQVGKAAMEMTLRRLKHNGLALPGVIIPTGFVGGATTCPEENTLLGLG